MFVFMLAISHMMCFPVKPIAKLTIPPESLQIIYACNFHNAQILPMW